MLSKRRAERCRILDCGAVNDEAEMDCGDAVARSELVSNVTESEVQTELCGEEILLLRQELNLSFERIHVLEGKIAEFQPFTEAILQNDECAVQFYTGLPNFLILNTVFTYVATATKTASGNTKLSQFQEFMVVMRLNLQMMKDLAYRFSISKSTVSRIWQKWITKMDISLRPLITWPERDDLRKPCQNVSVLLLATKWL